MALYIPTGDVAAEYVAVDPNLVRCGRVWNKDTYWGPCGRLWRC